MTQQDLAPSPAVDLLGPPASVARSATSGPDPRLVLEYARRSVDVTLSGAGGGVAAQPAALAEVADRFVLRRVAGSSVAAVGAACAAAAELGRRNGGAGPDGLRTLTERLARAGGPAALLAPPAGARGAFLAARAAAGGDRRQAVLHLLFDLAPSTRPLTALAALGTAVLTGALAWLLGTDDRTPVWVTLLVTLGVLLAGLLAAVAVALLTAASAALDLWRDRPAGLVDPLAAAPGLPSPMDAVADALDRLAGMPAGTALTFGHLWLGRTATGDADTVPLRRAADDPEHRVVDLRLHTTDLAAGMPLRLPPPPADTAERTGGPRLLFCATCLAGVLPGRVVHQVVAASPALQPEHRCPHHGAAGSAAGGAADGALRELPDPWDLPVALAVRASAAVPGVVAPVPLLTVTRAGTLRRLDLADGDLTDPATADTFDVLLPRWPTFSLRAGAEGALPLLGPLLGPVLGALLGSRERLAADRPGHRDRSVALTGAGPLAAMDADGVRAAAALGAQAGRDLADRFTGADGPVPGQSVADRYRWIRLRAAVDTYRRLSLDIATRLPVYSDLLARYRVPAELTGWFEPAVEAGARDPAWADAAAALTAIRAMSAGGVLDWDTGSGAPPA